MKTDRQLGASLALVAGGALWGLIWLPLRWLGAWGLAGAWPGLVMYSGAAAVLLPLAILRRRQIAAGGLALLMAGLATGAAFALYATAVILTDVVRALLLFYLTPVWGTALGLIVLGERLTLARLLALILAITGLMVVLGLGTQFPWPRNLGDWLALASGLAWAVGSLLMYRQGRLHPAETSMAFIFGSVTVTLLLVLVGGPEIGALPSSALALPLLPASLASALYILPMIVLTIWPAMRLTPGRVGLLLMSDVIVGVASAAWLAGEPFGMREALGTALIVAAAIVELTGDRTMPRQPG